MFLRSPDWGETQCLPAPFMPPKTLRRLTSLRVTFPSGFLLLEFFFVACVLFLVAVLSPLAHMCPEVSRFSWFLKTTTCIVQKKYLRGKRGCSTKVELTYRMVQKKCKWDMRNTVLKLHWPCLPLEIFWGLTSFFGVGGLLLDHWFCLISFIARLWDPNLLLLVSSWISQFVHI